MSINIPKALRALFTNDVVKVAMGDYNPGKLSRALALLGLVDAEIVGIDLIVLATCAQGLVGLPACEQYLRMALDEALPANELAEFLKDPRLADAEEPTLRDAHASLSTPSIEGMIAVARLQSVLLFADQEAAARAGGRIPDSTLQHARRRPVRDTENGPEAA